MIRTLPPVEKLKEEPCNLRREFSSTTLQGGLLFLKDVF